MEKLFAVSAPGLEVFTANELVTLRLLDRSMTPGNENSSQGLRIVNETDHMKAGHTRENQDEDSGGVEFSGSFEAIYRANLHLRTASRVLVRLGDFTATAFSELRKKAGRLPWECFLSPGQAVNVRSTCHKSRLYHSDAVSERILGAITDRLVQVPGVHHSLSNPYSPQLVVVRFVHDHCTISIDSSGELLHRRGYRQATAKAPLRETLAAGMLLASGWDGISSLLDPFCGSGTIAIEAAMLGRGLAPGRKRRFGFMNWPGFDKQLWDNLITENDLLVSERLQEIDLTWIGASDRDAGAIKLAKENAIRAGVADAIDFSCRAISAIEPKGKGWIVTNPPYGVRVSPKSDLRNLYAQLGKVLQKKCSGWQVAILCNDLQLLRQIGLPLDTSLSMVNGGVPVRLVKGEV